MIKIEIFRGKNQLVETKILNQKIVKIGREPYSDFFLADARISRQEMTFERQTDGTYIFRQKEFQRHFNEYFEIEFFDYKLKAFAIFPLSDEITQDLSRHPAGERATAISLFGWGTLFLALSFFDFFIYENWSKDNFKIGKEILSSGISVVGVTLLLSLVSRAVDGTYHFKRILSLALKASVVVGLISNNLMGLRWFLGTWIWFEQVYALLLIFCITYLIWQLGEIIFNHVSIRHRAVFLFLLLTTFLATQSVKYIPYRETYQYLTLRSPPPLFKTFESTAIPRSEFISKINSL